MSNHTTTIVPLESWSYASPEILANGASIDIGLFAEALIYYDCVIINVTNQPQLAELMNWFHKQGRLHDFLALVQEGSVKIYDYAFVTTAIRDGHTGSYSIWNVQDLIQEKPNTFESRFLYHKAIETFFPSARQRQKFYQAFRGNVIEVKAPEFGASLENAKADYNNPERNNIILQAFVDELYCIQKLGKPPKIQTSVQYSPDGSQKIISWNVDFNYLRQKAGPKLNFNLGTPLTAGAISNRLIWSSAQLSCDLFLPRPMSVLVGDKLYESTQRVAKAGNIITELKGEVEFPDIRSLVNLGQLNFQEILKIRNKAKKFRNWLQQEANRDRNAIIAYHKETARELGIVGTGRKTLSIFGAMTGGAVGALIGTAVAGPGGTALGGAIGSLPGYLTDIVSKMGADWKPVIFGNWLQQRIKKFIQENPTS